MVFFFFKQKTAYEMRISDWSSDVCSSDLGAGKTALRQAQGKWEKGVVETMHRRQFMGAAALGGLAVGLPAASWAAEDFAGLANRSEEHTSELQSLMRISYAVFCLKKKKPTIINYKSNSNLTSNHRADKLLR